jgi:hypothetical protein
MSEIELKCTLCKLEIRIPFEQFKGEETGLGISNLKCPSCNSKLKPTDILFGEWV